MEAQPLVIESLKWKDITEMMVTHLLNSIWRKLVDSDGCEFPEMTKTAFPNNTRYPHTACVHGQGAMILHFHLGYIPELSAEICKSLGI